VADERRPSDVKVSLLMRMGLIALTLFLVASGASGPGGTKTTAGPLGAFPRLTVWAWENPEDLRHLDARRYGVAYLDQTIFITSRVWSHPRLQRLLVTPDTRIIAVVRIEAARTGTEINNPSLPVQVAELIQPSAQKPRTAMLQIDFDATRSQRPFYINLLREVRKRMPALMPLSITVLASWCAADDWLGGLPVDEAVPMFFRMGPDHPPRDQTGWTYPLREPLCESSAGISMDEPWPALKADKRLYVFHPGAWTPEAIAELDAKVKP